MFTGIIDTYHQNSIDFAQVKANGVVAVIHKATQGVSVQDNKYLERRDQAKALGLLWGAYHFSTGDNVVDQVANFLSHAKPQDDELISLDWEPSDGPDMTLAQAREFVQLVHNETGRWPLVYGGQLLRASVGHAKDPILANCPLWYARYAAQPIGIPIATWPSYTLWQYTDGNAGSVQPMTTQGVSGADRSMFQGTAEQLAQSWPFTRRDSAAAPADAATASKPAAPAAAAAPQVRRAAKATA